MHRCLSSRIKSSFRVEYKSGKKQASGRRETPKTTTRPSATQTINSVDGLGTNKIFILFGLAAGAELPSKSVDLKRSAHKIGFS